VSETRQYEWFWLEAGALVATLVGGAVLRYWLSTVTPFDAAEVAVLADATDPERAMRVPFIMMNGVSLFLLYVITRRSAGVAAAFALQLLLQSSPSFQELALRVRLLGPVLFVSLLVCAYLRLSRPAWRLPRAPARVLAVLAVVLAGRELLLLATLPGRLRALRESTRADSTVLARNFDACGDPRELAFERFGRCPISWPELRSVDQQEALWEHQRRLGKDAIAVAAAREIPARLPSSYRALLDREAAGVILVPDGPLLSTARRVLAEP